MTFKPDWIYLRPALIIMSMALIFSLLIKLLGFYYFQEALAQHDQKNIEYNTIKTELNDVREEKRIIINFEKSFNRMVKAGLFDDKQRIEWVDAVNDARRKMKLPLARYQISPQEPYAANYLPVDEHIDVMSSQVKLDVGLLHEGDLISLFNLMESNAPGQLHFSQCVLVRTKDSFDYSSQHPNMSVSCELSWFRINPHKEDVLDG